MVDDAVEKLYDTTPGALLSIRISLFSKIGSIIISILLYISLWLISRECTTCGWLYFLYWRYPLLNEHKVCISLYVAKKVADKHQTKEAAGAECITYEEMKLRKIALLRGSGEPERPSTMMSLHALRRRVSRNNAN